MAIAHDETSRLLKYGVCRGAEPLAGSLRVSLRYNFLPLLGQGEAAGKLKKGFSVACYRCSAGYLQYR